MGGEAKCFPVKALYPTHLDGGRGHEDHRVHLASSHFIASVKRPACYYTRPPDKAQAGWSVWQTGDVDMSGVATRLSDSKRRAAAIAIQWRSPG